jgi:3-methyladenine DNA glycosylase AlkD
MPPGQPSIVETTHRALSELANPKTAREMAAYMKTSQPFYGVQNPARLPVFKQMCQMHAPADGSAYRAAVLSLWDAGLHGGDSEPADAWPAPFEYAPDEAPEPRRDSDMSPPEHRGPRELMYAACYYAERFNEHVTPAHLPLFKRMIVEGGWWDIVDWVGDKMVGHVLLTSRGAAAPVMRKWINDENLWVRRKALISQLHHKDQTDEKMLFEFCLHCADDEDFFIRKAIGWALRQHARTNPGAVKAFLKAHKPTLATISVREAGKHIGVKP